MSIKASGVNVRQAWIKREIFRVAAAARVLPTDSAEHGAALLLVTRMWEAFNEVAHA